MHIFFLIDKISDVKNERTSIIKYTEKRRMQLSGGTGSKPGSPGGPAGPETNGQTIEELEAALKSSAMLEMVRHLHWWCFSFLCLSHSAQNILYTLIGMKVYLLTLLMDLACAGGTAH